MQHPFFFGYGSLVNRKTHDYPNATPARVRGWKRVWRHTTVRPLAYLTAIPCDESEIDGLIAGVPDHDWANLDHRERAYDRHAIGDVQHALEATPEISIYWVPETKHPPAPECLPVLLSYIDVVVQGYLAEFGEDGVTDFFKSTDGWDVPVHDDRAAPVYPRHQVLSARERRLVDRFLDETQVHVTGMDDVQRRW